MADPFFIIMMARKHGLVLRLEGERVIATGEGPKPWGLINLLKANREGIRMVLQAEGAIAANA